MRVEEIQSSKRLIMLFKWSLVTLLALVALEIAHLVFLGEWNSEIFAAITGIIIGAKK